jgi:hypothetical protein
MVKYLYDKYNVNTRDYFYQDGDGWSDTTGIVSPGSRVYDSYTFSSSSGYQNLGTGVVVGEGYSSPAGYCWTTGNGTQVHKIVGAIWNGAYWDCTKEILVGSKTTLESQGTLVETGIVAEDGTYPENGIHTDGYWYVKGEIANNAPTITLNTADNFTLSETEGQNEILVDGSVTDADPNNTVTVKVQINDGTIRNIESEISDGVTPIPFSKLLTYSNKRVYDGATPLTVDLAENVDHTLKVWADDGAGGTSTIAERTFRVIHNRPPVINGSDSDLGTLIATPSITYQVNDLEGQEITVTEKLNGQVIRTFEAQPETDYTLEIPLEMWIPLALQQHTLTIEAVDTVGAKSTRTHTFTRTEDTILVELKNPFVTDIAATRVLVTPDVYMPVGSSIVIEACNNAFDEAPTWEDITEMAMQKRGHVFVNTEKTAEQWGINIRFTLNKGTATEQVRIDGFGGAFD